MDLDEFKAMVAAAAEEAAAEVARVEPAMGMQVVDLDNGNENSHDNENGYENGIGNGKGNKHVDELDMETNKQGDSIWESIEAAPSPSPALWETARTEIGIETEIETEIEMETEVQVKIEAKVDGTLIKTHSDAPEAAVVAAEIEAEIGTYEAAPSSSRKRARSRSETARESEEATPDPNKNGGYKKQKQFFDPGELERMISDAASAVAKSGLIDDRATSLVEKSATATATTTTTSDAKKDDDIVMSDLSAVKRSSPLIPPLPLLPSPPPPPTSASTARTHTHPRPRSYSHTHPAPRSYSPSSLSPPLSPRESIWTKSSQYTLRTYLLPTLGKVSIDILRTLSEHAIEDTFGTCQGTNEADRDVTIEWGSLVSFFHALCSQVCAGKSSQAQAQAQVQAQPPLLLSDELGINRPQDREILRVANLASLCSSMFGPGIVPWWEWECRFPSIFVSEGQPMKSQEGELYVSIKTQMYLSCINDPEPGASKSEFLRIIFDTGKMKSSLQSLHPHFPLTETELGLLSACEERKNVLFQGSQDDMFTYESFLDCLTAYINDNIETLDKLSTGELVFFGKLDVEALAAGAIRMAQRIEGPAMLSSAPAPLLFPSSPSNLMGTLHDQPQPQIQAQHQNQNQHPHQHQHRHQHHTQPQSHQIPSILPSLQPPQLPAQTATDSTTATQIHHHEHPQVLAQEGLHPQQSAATPVLYERARQAAMTRNSSHARREGSTSSRRPWTDEEEKYLMIGLDLVKGPHWSLILSYFGPTGTMSNVLKERNQVQLKDKARNLKLFFLKTNSEMPYYLRMVTGELKTRAPNQAAKRELEERQTAMVKARQEGTGIVAGRLPIANSEEALHAQQAHPPQHPQIKPLPPSHLPHPQPQLQQKAQETPHSHQHSQILTQSHPQPHSPAKPQRQPLPSQPHQKPHAEPKPQSQPHDTQSQSPSQPQPQRRHPVSNDNPLVANAVDGEETGHRKVANLQASSDKSITGSTSHGTVIVGNVINRAVNQGNGEPENITHGNKIGENGVRGTPPHRDACGPSRPADQTLPHSWNPINGNTSGGPASSPPLPHPIPMDHQRTGTMPTPTSKPQTQPITPRSKAFAPSRASAPTLSTSNPHMTPQHQAPRPINKVHTPQNHSYAQVQHPQQQQHQRQASPQCPLQKGSPQQQSLQITQQVLQRLATGPMSQATAFPTQQAQQSPSKPQPLHQAAQILPGSLPPHIPQVSPQAPDRSLPGPSQTSNRQPQGQSSYELRAQSRTPDAHPVQSTQSPRAQQSHAPLPQQSQNQTIQSPPPPQTQRAHLPSPQKRQNQQELESDAQPHTPDFKPLQSPQQPQVTAQSPRVPHPLPPRPPQPLSRSSEVPL